MNLSSPSLVPEEEVSVELGDTEFISALVRDKKLAIGARCIRYCDLVHSILLVHSIRLFHRHC